MACRECLLKFLRGDEAENLQNAATILASKPGRFTHYCGKCHTREVKHHENHCFLCSEKGKDALAEFRLFTYLGRAGGYHTIELEGPTKFRFKITDLVARGLWYHFAWEKESGEARSPETGA